MMDFTSAKSNKEIPRFSLSLLLITALAILTGCGAGTIDTVVNANTATGGSGLSLALISPTGTPVTSISSGSPATVKAILQNASGVAVSNAVVTFTTNTALGTITPTGGTALTDATGVATVSLAPANITAAGAAVITASAQVANTALTGSVGYTIGAATVTISTPVFGVGAASLSAFGTTSVTATVSSGGVAVTTPQTVNFTSACASSGKAVLSTGIATVNGVATASYRDNGCAGTDTITASVSGGLASSSAPLTITPPTTGSLQYISAIPTNIALKGSGGTPTSDVTFKVLDTGGNPISGKTVTFGLSTTIGGISLAAPSGISDAGGLVVAKVNSGTVSTPVRVTASTPGAAAGSTLTTQSSQLSITTGIPDMAGFSASATKLNIEGLTIDGVTTVLTARLADHFKNPVPDGTTVNFTAEAGSVVGTCSTLAGACSSTYTTQGTRPANGRVTILAYAIGEETFTDLNGNGVADLAPGNEMIDANGNPTDLPEAWVDYNENSQRDANEPFLDFNNDGAFNGTWDPITSTYSGDGKYSGVLCDNTVAPPAGSSAGTCAAAKTLHVKSRSVIILSSSTANITINAGSNIVLTGTPSQVTVTVVDQNGNAMPVGTTVALSTTNGAINSTASYIVPNTAGCRTSYPGCPASAASPTFGDYTVTMTGDGTASQGTFTVTVTTPSNSAALATTTTTATVTVTD